MSHPAHIWWWKVFFFLSECNHPPVISGNDNAYTVIPPFDIPSFCSCGSFESELGSRVPLGAPIVY